VDRSAFEDRLEGVRQVAEGVAVLRARKQQIPVLRIAARQGLDQIAGIGADPRVTDVAGVETDRIRQNKAPGQAGGAHPEPGALHKEYRLYPKTAKSAESAGDGFAKDL